MTGLPAEATIPPEEPRLTFPPDPDAHREAAQAALDACLSRLEQELAAERAADALQAEADARHNEEALAEDLSRLGQLAHDLQAALHAAQGLDPLRSVAPPALDAPAAPAGLTLRLPASLQARLAALARAEGVTVAELCLSVLSAWAAQQAPPDPNAGAAPTRPLV